ncbi:MAG: cation:proton antiporter subunit C [Halanaerobiales bacterium]|nr:cation:proton antiporter subunit C [Bacillota bacterium]HOA41293.1 cation:proton antiporter subunit C [Halanaerobiales bacterium]HPZ63519.1 cation:proton antiporter subunit C [Halanaerobiales bacterium]HQD03940.1 cation:proton antiporter subunit C [Halanaerobiales bacterium]
MRILLEKLLINYPFFFAIILFVMGAFTVLTRSNLFKKLIGINIMEGGIFLFFVAAGNIKGGAVPILVENNPGMTYINPLTSALMLTGIVVSVSVTAFALALIIRLYKIYGTVDARRIAEMRKEVKERWQE